MGFMFKMNVKFEEQGITEKILEVCRNFPNWSFGLNLGWETEITKGKWFPLIPYRIIGEEKPKPVRVNLSAWLNDNLKNNTFHFYWGCWTIFP